VTVCADRVHYCNGIAFALPATSSLSRGAVRSSSPRTGRASAGDGLTTNCCFGGPDRRTLYSTDALPGNVVAWERMPTPGLPLPMWPGLAP
jgi:hypothetical protein